MFTSQGNMLTVAVPAHGIRRLAHNIMDKVQMSKIKRGDKVETIKGDKFAGTVVAVFKNLEGEIRLVVQVDPSATADRPLHIFTEDNLQLVIQ